MLIRNAKDTAGKPIEVWLRGDKIAAIGQGLVVPEGEDVLDAKGRTILPAFIDTHCHWRTPGFEYTEDIATGSAAAAAGGYTFVNLMPNTKPVCSTPEIAHAVEAEAKRIVRQAQAQADEIFAQLDQLRRQQQKQINFQELNDAKAAVRHSLNQAQEALHLRSEPQEPAYAPSRPIEVGDLVELPGVKMAASVLAVNNDGTLLLQAGKMKMTVKAAQVRLLETAEEIEETA